MSFAKNLYQKRKELGLTTEELANRIHVSRSYVTLIENGKRLPNKSLLPQIAKALRSSKNLVIEWYLAEQLKKVGIKGKKSLDVIKKVLRMTEEETESLLTTMNERTESKPLNIKAETII